MQHNAVCNIIRNYIFNSSRGYWKQPDKCLYRSLFRGRERHFFDALVMRHAAGWNPFSSVRRRKHQVIDGQVAPEPTIQLLSTLATTTVTLDVTHIFGHTGNDR